PRPLLLINPMILLALGTVLGLAFAGRVGWRSALVDRLKRLPTNFSVGAAARMTALGIGAGAVIALADGLLRPIWQGSAQVASMTEGWSPAVLLVGLLYGG